LQPHSQYSPGVNIGSLSFGDTLIGVSTQCFP
jgi:hypothetical protein